MAGKKPPYTHREIAKAIYEAEEAIDKLENRRAILPTWLKIEAYTLFFTALPHLIAALIWVVIIAVVLWAVTLI